MCVWSGSAGLGLGVDAAGLRVLCGGTSEKRSGLCVGGCGWGGGADLLGILLQVGFLVILAAAQAMSQSKQRC